LTALPLVRLPAGWKPAADTLAGRVVLVTGAYGGLGSAVAEMLMESDVSSKFRRIGVRDTFAEGGTTPFLFEKYGLSANALAATVRQTLAQQER